MNSSLPYILIEGKHYSIDMALCQSHQSTSELQEILKKTFGPNSFHAALADFLTEWFNDKNTIKVHTSGSTGKPKELLVEKQRMVNSALATIKFLGIKKDDITLLCMPLPYIAGKMVVVRSLIKGLNLELVAPCGHPLAHIKHIPDFAAMTPMQVYNTLEVPEECDKLKQIRHLIIGGGAINSDMAKILKTFPNAVWSTYGMTETLSHIALRRLSGKDSSSWYTPFEGVNLSLSTNDTLIIHAPQVCPEVLHTNDIATFNEKGQFRILGRKDNTINTGGIKVQIEEIETRLHSELSVPFMITSVPDPKFGEHIVLLIENGDGQNHCIENLSTNKEGNVKEIEDTDNYYNKNRTNDRSVMVQKAISQLPTYWKPKSILSISKLPITGTGKPDRATAKRIASEYHKLNKNKI